MIFIVIFLIIFIILIFFIITNKANKANKKKHIHNNNLYPEMKYVFDNNNTIINEFNANILNSPNWSMWMEYDKTSSTPIFTQMSRDAIIKRMEENKCYLNNDNNDNDNNDNDNNDTNKTNNGWKIFGLILESEPIKENIKYCPKIMNILKKCNCIVNAGFSCLEPGTITTLHHDFNHNILRCHIPISIPKGDTAIKINDEIIKWNYDNYFIFDDTFDHIAWNLTNNKRIVLIIDILKNDLNQTQTNPIK
jgi:beta-hydroxylase